MSRHFLKISDLTFEYPSQTTPVISGLSLQLSRGWSGVIGANGCGKSTLLKLIAGLESPTAGDIQGAENVLYCEQRTDDLPADSEDWLYSEDSESYRLRHMLVVEPQWLGRWQTLSHGERKRIQIGAALYRQPEVLAVDEPSNHLDAASRNTLIEALKRYRGIGLIVSHDRTLLDAICKQCLFFEGHDVVVRPGGITAGLEQQSAERKNMVRVFDEAKKEHARLNRELRRRQKQAETNRKKSSKRHVASKDHDAKSKIDLGRLTGKDATANQLYKKMKTRVSKMEETLDQIRPDKEHISGIWINSSASRKRVLLSQPSGSLAMGDRLLKYPALMIERNDRIGIVGENGSGKSSLLTALMDRMADPSATLYIPQEISREKAQHALISMNRLDHEQRGRLMAVVRRLGSDPELLLESELPSPGELRKLLLAQGILSSPSMIIMDEPTNHMDLESMLHLERALAQVPCALVLVSHDQPFLNALVNTFWSIKKSEDDHYELQIT